MGGAPFGLDWCQVEVIARMSGTGIDVEVFADLQAMEGEVVAVLTARAERDRQRGEGREYPHRDSRGTA